MLKRLGPVGLVVLAGTWLGGAAACGSDAAGDPGNDPQGAGDTDRVAGDHSTYALNVTKSGSGSGSVTGAGLSCGPTCAVEVGAGASVTLTASPAGGSSFSGFSGCDSTSGQSCTVRMNADRHVTATFDVSAPGNVTLTLQKSGAGTGTVTGGGINCGTTCSAAVSQGATVTLSATAGSGSVFAGFSGSDSASGTSCTVQMTGSRTVTAAFNPSSVTLTVVKNGTGVGTVQGSGIDCGTTCSATAAWNTAVTLTATPGVCSMFTSFSGCDSTSGSSCTVTLSSAKSVTATFTRTTCTLTVAKAGTGVGTVTGSTVNCGATCTAEVPWNTAVTLTAAAGTCSSFGSFAGCDSASGTSCTLTPTDDRTVTTTFTKLVQICTPADTRCVAGSPGVVQSCDACGATWGQANCPAYAMCSHKVCHAACGLTSQPSYPAVCVVPNDDGVNAAMLMLWSDSRLAAGGSPVYTNAGFSTSVTLESAAGQTWPLAWSYGTTTSAFIQFKLSQFSSGRNVYLRYNAKRSGILGGATNYYTVGFFNGSTLLGSGNFGPVPSSYTAGWVSSGVLGFNYTGAWNQVMISITGDGYGGLPDLMELNWMLLEVH